MTYDAFGRQARWIFPSKTSPGVTNPADYEDYGHDPAGNRTRLRKRDGQELLYTYDALNRVTLKDSPGPTADVRYSYDLRGLQTAAWFTWTGRQLLRFVTDRRPTHAGVDPYNFYIDRNSFDNVGEVTG